MQNTPLKIRIAHLFPDLLNAYGDTGNVLALVKRAQWRDIHVEVIKVNAGDKIKASDFDLLFSGGAEDRQQVIASQELVRISSEIKDAANQGKPMLAICGSYQLFGKYCRPNEGNTIPGISVFDVYTTAGKKRFTGNVTALCDFLPVRTIVGFESHVGQTHLGPNAKPFLKIKTGNGNNGVDKTEGCRFNNAFGTYLHGPLLPKNPHFCDYLISCALNKKYDCEIPLVQLNDEIEYYAHESRICAKY